MIDYEPLFQTLKEKRMYIKDLYSIMHPETASKFAKGESVSMSIIMKLCITLDVPIFKVVVIRREDGTIIK